MKKSTHKIPDKQCPTAIRIVTTARKLFFSEGFSGVTTDRLCKAAAVSKSSLYKYFGDMTGVFSAVVQVEGDLVSDGVIAEPETAEQFWSSLTAYGCNLLTLLNQRDTIEFDRLLHEQSRRCPAMGKIFYDMTYGRSHVEITAMIEFGKRQGFITRMQPSEMLADQLFCGWEGLAFVRTRLGLTDKPYADPRTRARETVEAWFENDCKF